MKYLKYFEQASAYEAYKNGSNYILPNVSYIEETKGVSFESIKTNPNSVITYQANSKLTGVHTSAFNSTMISHEFADGIGTITFKKDVTYINYQAFANCMELKSINIPNSVKTIDIEAFYKCNSLTSINIPDSVTTIGDWAFAHCSSLTSITIPDSVTSIGSDMFYECSELTEIEYNGYMYQWQNIDFGMGWSERSVIERVICLDGVIELNTAAIVDYISPYDWDINLTVGNTRTLGFNLCDTSKSNITTAVYGEPKSANGNYYYYQYNDDAISVTDYGYDGKSGYWVDIHAQKPGTHYLEIYAGPGVKGDAMQSITITVS